MPVTDNFSDCLLLSALIRMLFFPLQIDFRVISFYLQPYASYFFLLQTNFLNGDIHRDDIHGVDQLLLRDVEEGSSDAAEEIEPENISLFI